MKSQIFAAHWTKLPFLYSAHCWKYRARTYFAIFSAISWSTQCRFDMCTQCIKFCCSFTARWTHLCKIQRATGQCTVHSVIQCDKNCRLHSLFKWKVQGWVPNNVWCKKKCWVLSLSKWRLHTTVQFIALCSTKCIVSYWTLRVAKVAAAPKLVHS